MLAKLAAIILLAGALAGCAPQTANDQAYTLGLLNILAGMEAAKMQSQSFHTSSCRITSIGTLDCTSF